MNDITGTSAAAAVSAWSTSTSPAVSPLSITHLTHDNSNTVVVGADYNPRLPNGIIVAILMVVGIVGNGLVLYVYHFKFDRTVFHTFVTVLALLDLSTALITMPIDVVIKTVLFGRTEALNAVCKVAHFDAYTSSLASGSVLLLITVTRYKKVCTPLEPGLTLHKARVLCGIIVLLAATFCTVTFIINGTEKVKVIVGERENDGGSLATPLLQQKAGNATSLDHKQKAYTSGPVQEQGHFKFSINPSSAMTNSSDPRSVRLEAEAGTSLSLAPKTPSEPERSTVTTGHAAAKASGKVIEVVEVYICRTNESQKKAVLYYALQVLLMLAFVVIFVSLIVLQYKISVSVVEFERRNSSMRSVSSNQEYRQTQISSTMFRIFMTITIIFLISYLPHLICFILEIALYKPGQAMPQVVRIVLDLAYNVPYINVVANPFIYGYKSTDFRKHCKELASKFCHCCCHCVRDNHYYR